ncbi:MAG: HNH endonuclease [Candidatus Zixiibacteriota bacterium]
MFAPGDIISYLDMCVFEKVNLQRGMNFHINGNISVILMSIRVGAPYADRIEDNGKTLIYEGHDISKVKDGPDPKTANQPKYNSNGTLTQNGLFYEAARDFVNGKTKAELVRVYEKIRSGIWVFVGVFRLVDAWIDNATMRNVFKFRLTLNDETAINNEGQIDLDHNRLIPSSVKLAVWKRDKGRCTKCGSKDNLHFDHVIPYSKGGSSLVPENIQLLCARHNLEKRDKIE